MPNAVHRSFPLNLGKIAVLNPSAKVNKRFAVENAVDFKLGCNDHFLSSYWGCGWTNHSIGFATKAKNSRERPFGILGITQFRFKGIVFDEGIRKSVARYRVVNVLYRCIIFFYGSYFKWMEFY